MSNTHTLTGGWVADPHSLTGRSYKVTCDTCSIADSTHETRPVGHTKSVTIQHSVRRHHAADTICKVGVMA